MFVCCNVSPLFFSLFKSIDMNNTSMRLTTTVKMRSPKLTYIDGKNQPSQYMLINVSGWKNTGSIKRTSGLEKAIKKAPCTIAANTFSPELLRETITVSPSIV